MFTAALLCQLSLLLFRQITTLVDVYPFNNVRNFTPKERLLECGINSVLMALPLVGFLLHVE